MFQKIVLNLGLIRIFTLVHYVIAPSRFHSSTRYLRYNFCNITQKADPLLFCSPEQKSLTPILSLSLSFFLPRRRFSHRCLRHALHSLHTRPAAATAALPIAAYAKLTCPRTQPPPTTTTTKKLLAVEAGFCQPGYDSARYTLNDIIIWVFLTMIIS
jgi:hypothetical protein